MATELELRQSVVKVMQRWLGYSEKNGKFKQIIDLYNTQKPLPVGYKVQYEMNGAPPPLPPQVWPLASTTLSLESVVAPG